MSTFKILVEAEISVDERYCHKCGHMEHCPPGCRLFNKPLTLCLGGGPLRCEECLECLEAEKKKL